jgi:predicted thioredoxin/glutaredoxin
VKVVLVTRHGCHLCDEALSLLRDLGLHPQLADVDADDELHRLYDFRVPVVLVDGAVIAEGRITRDSLEGTLKRSGRGPGGPDIAS